MAIDGFPTITALRSGQLEAEEVNGEVARGAVHQHARNKPPMMKRISILTLRELVAAASLNVRQNRGRHGCLCPLLQKLEVGGEAGKHAAKAFEVDLSLIVGQNGAFSACSFQSEFGWSAGSEIRALTLAIRRVSVLR